MSVGQPPGEPPIGVAETSGADTIVVGSSHRGRIGRALLGGVADHLLDHAPCEVVVAPHGYADEGHTGLAKVAVAVDGTPESKVALSRAEDLARQAGARIEILVASDPVVAACDSDVDLLVAGSRGPIDHMLLGSITKRLVVEAPCPVLVVPDSKRA